MISRARLKFLRSLARKKERREHGQLLLEGPRVVEEAVRAGVVETLFLADAVEMETTLPVERLDGPDVDALQETRNSAGVFALARDPVRPFDASLVEGDAPLVLADGMADPGNLGTVIRTAAALGFGAVVCAEGSVEATNPKVVRATAGALFQIPVLRGSRDELTAAGYALWAADAGGEPVRDADTRPARVALLLGNEPRGIDPAARSEAARVVSVPMAAGVESLNVAAAAAILMDRIRTLQVAHP